MSKACTMCGSDLPDSHPHKTCSLCYGDLDYGTDGYYREYMEELQRQEQEKEENDE